MANIEELKLALKRVEQAAEVDLALIPRGRGHWDEEGNWILEEKPEEPGWYQASWVRSAQLPEEGFCLTAGCFAGHTVMAHGFTEAVVESVPGLIGKQTRGVRNPDTGEELDSVHDQPSSTSIFEDPLCIAGRAAQILGLDAWQAAALFAGNNSLDDLRAIVDRIVTQDEEADHG